MYKIIGADQKEYGPVTANQISRWIVQGRVNALTKVQAEGGEWKTLGQFPEFAAALGSRAAAAPSGPPNPAAYGTGPVKTSGLAVASLVLGILGLPTCGFTAIVGLVLGIVGMNQVKKSNGAMGGHGLALAGTIVSAAFILMIPMSAAMFLPAFAKAKQRAQTIECVNNVKQLALATMIFSGDHNNHFPSAANWCDALSSNSIAAKVFHCPAADPTDRCDYAFNANLDGMDAGNVNPNTVLFFESDGGWNQSGGPELMLHQSRHFRLFIVAFADGRVQQMTAPQLARLRWNP